MRTAVVLLVPVFLPVLVWAADPPERFAPAYSAASLVNSASNQPGPLAPNTIASLYGTDLAYVTRALASSDIHANSLPTVLPNTGVRVLVNNLFCHIYFVSERQVNLLIPSTLVPGPAELILVVESRAGPPVKFTLAEAAPALFVQPENLVIATRPDGSLITRESRARPGDWVILYATGLGPTTPAAGYGALARSAAPLARFADFQVLLNGAPVPAGHIGYAGLAPGFAGLYQVNLQVPEAVPPDPELRLAASGQSSPPGTKLLTAP